jgi:LTXXQ motif family protein
MRASTLDSLFVAIGLACSLVTVQALAQDTSAQEVTIEELQADAWLNSLKSQLQLTGEPEGAFEAYAAAIREQAKLKAANRTSTLFVDTARLPSAPRALEARVDQLQQRITALKNVQGAAAKLYDLLGPQQRTVFDFIALTPTGVGTFEQL